MAVMYTSGTTGPSKGVMITQAHAYEYALSVVELLELRSNDVYYAPLPLFHIAGQWAVVYACCIRSATAVLAGTFGLGKFWDEVNHYHATCTFLLGAMANFLYQQPETPQDTDNTLERALVVPLLPETEQFKQRFDCLVSATWGSTEVNVPMRSGFILPNSRTCGRVATDRYEVRIVDKDDNELPPNVPGEAVVRAKEPWILMAGYWNHPKWTVSAWRNLWLHSGDMLMRDEQGNFYFVDRIKDAIRRRGENISSMEVENEINLNSSVLECAVIPVDSTHTEQEVMAVVVLRDDERLDPLELTKFLEPRMAYFMVPRYIDIVEALPKTQTGKIQKYKLRENGITPTTWDREAAGYKLKK
jgi:crotonobetaine/carnitine-CoA ligase